MRNCESEAGINWFKNKRLFFVKIKKKNTVGDPHRHQSYLDNYILSGLEQKMCTF